MTSPAKGVAARALKAAILAGGLALVLTAGGVRAAGPTPSPGEMSLGNANAPVTLIEYASVGCPHCAVWANDVFPRFRHKYIDTGKVRFVFREMLTGNGALAAAGFLTARCAAPDKYFQVVDDVFAQQAEISRVGAEALAKIAEHAGVNHDRFTACLQDDKALKVLSERTTADAKAHGVDSTPTFFVGDERLAGEHDLQAIEAAINRARPGH